MKLLLALACVLVAACDTTLGPSVGGSLDITVEGLPTGAQAALTLAGPGGFNRPVTASTRLTLLPSGTYTLTAANVTSNGATYVGDPATQSVTVTAATAATAKVSYSVVADAITLGLEAVGSGFDNPVYVTSPPNDQRLFVVEQTGRIKVIANGGTLATPFLDIRSQITSGGERGLLSMAFHPSFATNGFFFVDFTDVNGNTRVVRYHVSGNPNVADAASGTLILQVAQPFENHNGGLVMFGPDGMLYIGTGDGGSGGDPLGNGQGRATLLGKLLRIDVNGALPYAVPPSNPFVGQSATRPEIWALGLRNPWRFAFDRQDGVLYIADVGQSQREEINAVPAAQGGQNYGWNVMEGTICYIAASCTRTGLTLPVFDYSHSEGCSITGGYVYRGTRLPEVAGRYFYSDYCGGWLRSIRVTNGTASAPRDWNIPSVGSITSFGEDSSGELYVTSTNGTVYRLVRR